MLDRLSSIAWNNVVPETIGLLGREILNREEIFNLVYKSVSIPLMLYNLGRVGHNSLVIGKDHCWLAVAKTCHPNHFVGTEKMISLKAKNNDYTRWCRIQDLLLRHATPGATVGIHLLNPHVPQIEPVAMVVKAKASQYQPPGCSQPHTNGFALPFNCKLPIGQEDLDGEWIPKWKETHDAIIEAMKR